MNWLVLSLAAPFLWSILNHADKYLISKYSKQTGVGGIVVFSCIFSIIIIPFVYLIDPRIVLSDWVEIVSLMVTGAFLSGAVLLSLYAFECEDASYVVPFWLLSPLFGYILGLIFLGETLSVEKIIGSAVVAIGAIFLSIEFEGNAKVKAKPIILMALSSLCLAAGDVLFKGFAEHATFWSSIFWNQIGTAIFGIICLIFVTRYRNDFKSIVVSRDPRFIAINIFGEIFLVAANVLNYLAMLAAPVSLVLLVNYTSQPLFVFVEGVLITLYLPHISKEKLSKGGVVQKLLSTAVMCIGIYFIYN